MDKKVDQKKVYKLHSQAKKRKLTQKKIKIEPKHDFKIFKNVKKFLFHLIPFETEKY
jgi:hypothetical protein